MLRALLYHALSNVLVIAYLIYSFQHYRFKYLSGLFGVSRHFFNVYWLRIKMSVYYAQYIIYDFSFLKTTN